MLVKKSEVYKRNRNIWNYTIQNENVTVTNDDVLQYEGVFREWNQVEICVKATVCSYDVILSKTLSFLL